MIWELKSFFKNDRGNMTLVAAVGMIPIILGIGVAVDSSLLTKTKNDAQNQLDSAVLAAIQENSSGQARTMLNQKIGHKVDNFQLKDFSYDVSSEKTSVSAVMTTNYQLVFGGIFGKSDAEIRVSSTAESLVDISELVFRPISAKGQYHKDIYLKVLRHSGDVETVGTFSYDPTLPSPFVVSSANWIQLGDYKKIILEMRVHYDVEAGATASLKGWYGEDQTFAVDEDGFSEHLWVDGVQLRPDEIITNETLFSCNATRRHNWEDVPRGYPTTDTPDFEFEILSKCGASKNNIRIVD